MRPCFQLWILMLAALPAAAFAQSEPAPAKQPAAKGVTPAAATDTMLSTAERIARLQRSIDTGQQRLQELEKILNDPESEYHLAKLKFESLDAAVQATRARMQEELDQSMVAELQLQLEELEKKWKLAKDDFELEIQERKIIQEEVATLQKKTQADLVAQQQLTKPAVVAAPAEVKPATTEPAPQAAPPAEPAAAAPALSPAALTPLGAIAEAAKPAEPAAAPAQTETPPTAAIPDKPPRKEVIAATEAVRQTEAEALVAENAAQSVAERMELLRQSIRQTRVLRETARKKVDNCDEAMRQAQQVLDQKLAEGATPATIRDLNEQIDVAIKRWRSARDESRLTSNRLDELQTELDHLLSEKIEADQELEKKRKEANTAKAHLAHMQNPFTPQNLMNWAAAHAPKIIGVLLSMVVFVWLSRVFETRIVDLIARKGGRGGVEERENRAKTLVGVFRNVATLVILSGGVMTLLDEIGLPVGPLMGGAAVAGLAVAFGAQNLIRDFFTGFIILMEQQYMVNDVIKIGDVGGQVERITLRMTVLRDLEGRVHFMPHGQISSVTNLTHGWSRAVLEVGIAYKEDVDRVIEILMELGRQLRNDPEYGPLILEDPMMLGVDAFSDSAVIIKFYIKTRPLRQWPVKRELLRRIKNTFDQVGIEIPFPHRTVYHHNVVGGKEEMISGHEDWPQKQAG